MGPWLPAPAWADPGSDAKALATRLVEEIGPRPAGSLAGDDAQEWVARELAARGWRPERFDPGPWGAVLACRRGASRRVVLFLAHTDSVHARAPGANDNAAAVAVLLVASAVLPELPARTVCLGFPDAEELGLRASFALADAPHVLPGPLDQVMALDLVGVGELTHHGLGPQFGTERLRALMAVAPAQVPWVYRGLSHAWPVLERSDHLPFTLRGLPASHLMARGESGVDWAYHTPGDVPQRLDPTTLGDAVATVVAVANSGPLPQDDGDPAFVWPRTSVVVNGRATWGLLWLSPVLSLVALRGRVDLRAAGGGVASFVGRSSVAALAAVVAIAVATMGRPWDRALADPALLAGWSAWIAVFAAWRPQIPPVVGRIVGVLVAWAVAVALHDAPLLAMPFAVGAAGVAWTGPGWRRVGVLPALIVALHLLRPDAVRELAFHGLVPASLPVWGLAWLVLTAPVAGGVPASTARRWAPALAAALGVAAWIWAWSSPVERPPWVRGEVLGPVDGQ